MGHNRHRDTCVICGYQFDGDEDDTLIVAGRIRPVCPDCRGKLRAVTTPYLFRVTVYATSKREDLIDSWLTSDDIFESQITEDEGVEITIVSV